MSVGGVGHRNRSVTTSPCLVVSFSSGVSPAPQVPLLDASEVPRQEKFFHSLLTQFLWCIASFESFARRSLSLYSSVPRPFLLERDISVCFCLKNYFDNSRTQRLLWRLLIFKLPKNCCRNRILSVPRPLLVERRNAFPRFLNWAISILPK